MRCNRIFPALLLAAGLCFIGIQARAEVNVPAQPQNYVVDLAGVIDDGVEAALDRTLLELEQKTTAQMVVLTIPSLKGESIEEFSISLAHDRWKLGQKGKDNGVLLLVAVNDRKYRFEIGYGLEGVLPDSFVGSVGRQYLVPYFRKGDYSDGIYAATLAVVHEIANNAGVRITGMPAARAGRAYTEGGREGQSAVGTIFSIALFLLFLYMLIRHPRLLLLLLVMNTLGGGRSGGWGGGGGFGDGGFGGGGGGGFGGGGASGGW